MLSVREQEDLVRCLDGDPELREAVETLSGKSFADMTFQEKVYALAHIQETGRGAAVLAASFRSIRDVRDLAAAARGDIELSDRITLLETAVESRDEEITRLREELRAANSRPVQKPRRTSTRAGAVPAPAFSEVTA